MDYYFARTLSASFDDALGRATEALKQEGFGIISDIDVAATMRAKLGVEFRKYRILGACNPMLAHEALQLEDKIGLMLPCNVIVQDKGDGRTEVAVIDPVASMLAVENAPLKQAAEIVRAKLKAAVERL
ncbi:DUF302 domain-containing protein [Defluviicoccus vanus]|uniref:DUF302 domain-containing protein n=1 Tax=Defluviicoccus vanus TaxID=111831 RepID=A0A7H1N6Z2_9PROT|nr:DUF302 domain-containing protein [Defluviicoccus vanus]QNT71478.1 DUF302 domain-containing protein [Defluviicoccus vanus]